MRRALQEGHAPLPLQENGTSRSCPAVRATGAREAVGEDAAAQVGSKVVLDPAGDAVAQGIGLLGGGKKRLQVVLDDRIEGCRDRASGAIAERPRDVADRGVGRDSGTVEMACWRGWCSHARGLPRSLGPGHGGGGRRGPYAALCEGASDSASARQVGVSKVTVLKLLADIGRACLDYMRQTLVNLPCRTLRCDELGL